MIESCVLQLQRYSRGVILLVFAITLFFGFCLSKVKINASPYFLSTEHETRVNEYNIDKLFQNTGEHLIIMVKSSKDTIYNFSSLYLIDELTYQLGKISIITPDEFEEISTYAVDEGSKSIIENINIKDVGVDIKINKLHEYLSKKQLVSDVNLNRLKQIQFLSNPIRDIRSLSNTKTMVADEDDLYFDDVMPVIPENSKVLKMLRDKVTENPLLKDLYVSDDQKAALIQIELNIPEDLTSIVIRLYDEVNKIVGTYDTEDSIYLAGGPAINVEMAKTMEHDNLVFLPFVNGILIIILLLCFGSMLGFLFPMVVAGITVVWTLGLMTLLGYEQNIVTTTLPVFLLTVAVTDSIHVYYGYIQKRPLEGLSSPVVKSLSVLMTPLCITTLTTLLGFLALTWTDLYFVKIFGAFMAVGVITALLVTLLIAPAFLHPSRHNKASGFKFAFQRQIEVLITWLFKAIITSTGVFKIGIVLIFSFSLFSLINLKVDQENIGAFAEGSQLRESHKVLLEHFGGVIPADIWVDTGQVDGVYDPEIMRALDKFESYLISLDDVGYTIGPAKFVKRMDDLLTGNGFAIPENLSREMIAQELFIYENEGSQRIRDLIDETHRHARLFILSPTDRGSNWVNLTQNIESKAKELFPPSVKVYINGYGPVMANNLESVITNQIVSVSAAMLAIGVIMVMMFKSFIIGLIGMAPLVLTICMNFMLMTLLDAPIDIATSILASISFGIGVDYSIHLLTAFIRLRREKDLAIHKSIKEMMLGVGTPVVISSLALAAGFVVLMASNFEPIANLGFFIALTMVISAINALIVIPLLLVIFGKHIDARQKD